MRTQWEIDNAFAPRKELENYRSFYLVGIGGASMSALAKLLKNMGYSVSGSDSTASPVTSELMTLDIAIRIGHSGEGIKASDAVILTDAIDLKTSPEVAKALELGCSIFRRSQLLGWILEGKKTIAITGTHGKTTTTGLTACALIKAGFDPLVINGARIPQWDSPIREGEGKWAVIEACEAYNSLRDYDPHVVILTNLEMDHEDFYQDGFSQLKDTVLDFVNRIPVDGALVYCENDPGACEIAKEAKCPVIPYNSQYTERVSVDLKPRIPGVMNFLNACGALLAAQTVGADVSLAAEGISEFQGAERRQEFIGEKDGVLVYDDYAHHPTEIIESIKAFRSLPHKRLVVVFQPHLYSRTAAHLEGFAEALSLADHVVLTDIYPAREAPIPGMSSARIAEMIDKPVTYVPCRHLLPREVARFAEKGDLVVGMGAGNIDQFVRDFVKELDRPKSPKKICVAYAGDSAEREVSILSGNAIAGALQGKGYEVSLVDFSEQLLKNGGIKELTGPSRPDVVFLAVHGTNAEDGAIQGFLELLHLPYTGSGIQSSAISMDKQLSKQILEAKKVPVPKGVLWRRGEPKPDLPKIPVVVKPNAQGSTVGLSFVTEESELHSAIAKAFQYDDAILIEELVVGTEISTPILGDRALLPVEIIPATGAYDFAAKYTVGATEEICPARLSPEVTQLAQQYALMAHEAVGAAGATRTDMIVKESGEIVVLEVNGLPGMTGTSLLPKSAAQCGIPFPDLCTWLVEDAWRRHGAKA